MKTRLVTTALLFATVGCDVVDPPSPEPPATPPAQLDDELPAAAEHAERFAGTWLVDQPYHAGYEASFYKLARDGSLALIGSEDFGGGFMPGFAETGTVSIVVEDCQATSWWCETETTCAFGERWRSDGDATLIVDGECDDGEAREIELSFSGEASGNAEGRTVVEVVRIGEVTERVRHQGPEWRFVKCHDAEGAPLSSSWECTEGE